MMVWIIAAVMSMAAIAAVLFPLLRRQHSPVDAAAYDIEVYKDQLNQVSQDYDRGLLTAEQAQAAKTEISRRILNADQKREKARSAGAISGGANKVLAGVLAVFIPAAALGIYGSLGAPELPGQPFAERPKPQQTQTASGQSPMSLEESAARLARRLAKEPGNLQGWVLLARTYKSLGQYAESVEAFKRALGLDSGDANLTSAYGEALYLAAGRIVTPESRSAFEETLKREPGEPRARYYLAMAEEQAGNKQGALDGWVAMVADAPADAPWLPGVREQITKVAGELGIEVASVMPEPKAPPASAADGDKPARGPTAEDVAAAQQMSPEERQQMIAGMIEGLANRLAENPNDFQGWLRLIRAYAVQNQKDKALEALAKARDTFKRAPFPMQRLAALAQELGLESASNEPGPTQEDVRAAQEMSPEDRRAMIESMVARLADRMAENPNDVAGWTRLARSYNVLGQVDKAREALGKALKVAPDNIDLLILYGRTVRGTNNDRQTPESVATMRKVLTLDPNHLEALWYVGSAEAAAGNTAQARTLWERALNQLPAGSRERAQIQQRLDALP